MFPLDSTLWLTRGNPLGPTAILSHLDPAVLTYTGVCQCNHGDIPLMAQLQYTLGTRSAHLGYVMPAEALETQDFSSLLEHLTQQAGDWGAFHLLAEVDEHSLAFEALRKVAFSIYAWQRIWQYDGEEEKSTPAYTWHNAREVDVIPVRTLYQLVVPALFQPVESLPSRRLRGLVYRREGELLAYADLVYGKYGIWVQPFIHPAVEDASELLVDLLRCLPNRKERRVYICVRSYQAWLETTLEELDLQVGQRQAVMVKHLAIIQRSTMPMRIPALENGQGEPSAPLVHVDRHLN